MSRHAMNRRSSPRHRPPTPGRPPLFRRRRSLAGMVLGFLIATSATGTLAYAVLNAIVFNSAESVTSAKLSLSLADNGVGFTQAVSGLLPGDTVHRYAVITNNGTADAVDLSMAVASSTANKLTTDAANGLHIAVAACSGGAWTPTTNVCSGTVVPLVASTPLAGFPSAQSVVAGAYPAGAQSQLRVTLTLPDQVETTTNGTLPANSIQSLSTTLTYTFSVAQRAGTTTSS